MASQGPLNPSAASGTAWTNAAGIEGSSTFATRNVLSGVTVTTAPLIGTNFGFSIPSSATILGVEVVFARGISINQAGLTVNTHSVQLLKGGSATGTAKTPGDSWGIGATDEDLGNSSDLWGATLSYSDVNGSGFGFEMSANVDNSGGAGTAQIESQNYRVTVTYSVAGFTTCQTSTFGF